MGFLENRDLSDVPLIGEFYKGKTVFITGGSGFMGKVLIEKLLYSCNGLDRIYLLLRSKRGVNSKDRLAQLYASQCFDRLRRERPDVFYSKVFVMSGDVTELGFGLSDEDRATLVNKVNIIFHVAASVRFDDPLTVAVKLNLRGTREMIDLAKDIKDLQVLVHVSTSYSNTNHDPVEEILYEAHADWRETIEICESIDEHTIRVLTPKYLGVIPNTYTFTKQLAEHVVCEQNGKLPIIIIRPSIVISSVEEPFPGWIENFNGPVGIFVACGKGIMRSLHTDPNLIADYMPVDVSIKNMIAASWIRGTKKLESTDVVEIYNSTAGSLNHMTMKEVIEVGKQIAKDFPLHGVLWSVGGDVTTSASKHYIKVLFFHLLPALFVDLILWITGKKPMLVKIQRRIYIANLVLQYYITQQWTFDNKNFVDLRSCIKTDDFNDFYYEVENIDKYQFFKACVIGGRKFLLKEKDEDLPKAKAHYNRIVILDKVVQCVFHGLLVWWLLNTSFVIGFGQSLKEFMISVV